MKRISKTLPLLLGMTVTLTTGCSSIDEKIISAGDYSRSECEHSTRGWSVEGNPILKLTREGDKIYGEIQNCKVYCVAEPTLDCKAEEKHLDIHIEKGEPTACVCYVNFYFTVFNATDDSYQVVLDDEPLGSVSFAGHKTVQIDLTNREQAYEGGFEYPVKGIVSYVYDIADYPHATTTPTLRFGGIIEDGVVYSGFYFMNYPMPCEDASYDVEVEQGDDGTLEINMVCNRRRGADCNRLGDFIFRLVNLQPKNYHFRLNLVNRTSDNAGKPTIESKCVYEGELQLENGKETETTVELR